MLNYLAARVTTVEGSIKKVTRNLQSTTLIANNAHFEVRKLNDKLASKEKLTKHSKLQWMIYRGD